MQSLPKSNAITIVSWITIVTGIFVIVSWIFRLPGLETYFPHYVSMRFNTALCFSLAGGALLITQYQHKKKAGVWVIFLSALTAFTGALSLSQNIFHFNTGIDELFITDYLAAAEKYRFPGRMAPNVSFCFLLTGLALLGAFAKNRLIKVISQYALHLVTVFSVVAIIGYLYNVTLFYNFSFVASMAAQSAVLFFIISITATLLQPSLGITSLFTGGLVGNKVARRLFVLIALMVIVFGELRLLSQRYQLLPAEIGIPLLIVFFLGTSLLIIWYTARWLNRVDGKRYEAEEEIKALNEELEERVQERTNELQNLLEKFRESESKFRAAFEHSGIGMALVSFKGEWLKVNRRLCELLGYTEEELLSMTFMDITYPDDREISAGGMEMAATGLKESHRIEKRYLCKNGSVIWASVNISTVSDEQGRPVYMVNQIEDITERKKIDARFRAIVEGVFVGIKLNDANGSIIYRSPSMKAINGWTDEEMDRNYFKLAHPDDLERIEDVHREVLANPGKSINIIYRILHKDGHYIWIESLLCNRLSDPELGAIITVTRDITERKTIEDQLKKSERKYHSLIEHASDAIYLLDFEGNITEANESMCEMTGYSNDELLKMKIAELVDPEQLKTDPLPYGPVDTETSIIRERRLRRKHGQVFDVEINVKTIADNQVLVIARDITDRKLMQASLREAELKFRTLAEKSMVGVYISQAERFIYVNPRFAEIFGYEPEELVNTKESAVDIIIWDEDRPTVRENVGARYRGDIENAHYEVRGKRKDGTLNYVEFFGSRVTIDGKICIIGTMLDITERKKVEELIVREKTLSDTIINSLPEVFYLRSSDGAFLRWNKNFEKVTGYSPEEIKTLDSRQQLAEEDRGLVKGAVEQMLKEGHATVEASVVTKAGDKIPFLITISSITYENQPCVLGIAIDISSRKKAEEELRSSEHKYKLLFESNPLPMWMIAKDDLSVIAANDATSALYGYTKDELLSMKATQFRPSEDFDEQMEDWQTDMSDITSQRIIRHVKKDGTIIFVQIIAHDIEFEGRLVRLAFSNDVTEKIKAEETLKKSEANLKTIMDTTDTAYALLDKELNVVTYNQMAVKFVNSQFRQFPSEPGRLADYFPKDRFAEFVRYAGEVLNGRSISYEISYPQPDGSVSWYYVRLFPIMNDAKKILGLMLALSDITERKNAEDSLKVAYKLVQDHINSIKEMAWKQSHLVRSPVANLKGLVAMLAMDYSNAKVQEYITAELERLDKIIIEMAEDASNHD
ncbi:MAG TPA: PAS domain S-box protein [Mucilaginibacter sp.]|nr:PAS domain S-box protein [Mucilaginibacter sp.]